MIEKIASGVLVCGGVVMATLGKILNPAETIFSGGITGLGFILFGCGILVYIVLIIAPSRDNN